MMDPRQPKYEWGQRVRASIDLHNDGSHPQADAQALLVPAGGLGEIVQVGHHTEANVPVYLVESSAGPGHTVLGVLEEEITLDVAGAPRLSRPEGA